MLFTDIEGSTRLLQEHGRRFADMLGEHQPPAAGAAQRHGGVEFGSEGDALFFAFTAARDAAAAARDAQAALAGGPVSRPHGRSTPASRRSTATTTWASTCNRAARICAVAHGGQVVLSERTQALLGDAFECVPLGAAQAQGPARAREAVPARARRSSLRCDRSTPRTSPRRPRGWSAAAPSWATIQELLREHRLVTLTGAGGAGKTRLALEATAQCRDEFDDGVWWAPLAAVSEPDLVLPTVAQTLGAQVPLAEHIDERRMLILLDNLEQVVDCAPAISALLAACPDLTLLATSRTPLRLRAEREYAVPPLDARRRGRALRRSRGRAPSRSQRCARSARAWTHLPLAIELAAARTRVLAPPELLDRLERRLALLTEGPVDAPDRHVTLRATIEWSYELLDPEEAEHFARLSVFAGSFDAAAALAVCGTQPRFARVADRAEPAGAIAERPLLHARDDPRVRRRATRPTLRSFGGATPSTTSRSRAPPGSPTTRRARCATT